MIDWKELAVFLAIFYVALWAGSLIMGSVGTSITDPMTISLLGVVIPGTLLYWVWHKWGKKVAA